MTDTSISIGLNSTASLSWSAFHTLILRAEANVADITAQTALLQITISDTPIFAGIYTIDVTHTTLGPVNLALPSILGGHDIGDVLTVRSGLWLHNPTLTNPTMTVTQHWYRDGIPITGAIGMSYIVTEADISTSLSVIEITNDGNGTQTAHSAPILIPNGSI